MTHNKIYNAVPDTTLVGSIILAFLLDRNFPIMKIIPFPANLIGWLIIVAGVGLAVYTLTALRSKHTSTNPAGVPAELITHGLYSFSRNPFYLSYVAIATGMAFVFGSLAAFAAPVICFAVIHLAIIPLEERNLQKKFGQGYARYTQLVRRWL